MSEMPKTRRSEPREIAAVARRLVQHTDPAEIAAIYVAFNQRPTCHELADMRRDMESAGVTITVKQSAIVLRAAGSRPVSNANSWVNETVRGLIARGLPRRVAPHFASLRAMPDGRR